MSNLSKGSVPPGTTSRFSQDGSKNPKYVDLLDEDKSVAGQKFVCISFISPEKLLKQRNEFYFQEFLNQWELSKSMDKYLQFLHFVAYKYNLDSETLSKDLQDFIKDEKNNLFGDGSLSDDYKNFIDAHEEALETSFNNSNEFQTSVRGVKVRGSYPSQQEAELRCQMLREVDPNHDVFVGPVGLWMPFHPEAYQTGRVEYLEDELNQLMHDKVKNEKRANQEFEKRIKETRVKAMEENKKRALESGNPLTQTLNENGELINVRNMNTQEQAIQANNTGDVIAADIRKELFEGQDVVTDLGGDHGLSDLTGNIKFVLKDDVTETGDDKSTEDSETSEELNPLNPLEASVIQDDS